MLEYGEHDVGVYNSPFYYILLRLMKNTIIISLFLASLALAQPQTVAVLPSLADPESNITPKQLDNLTNDIRTIATNVLPSNFAVLKQDAIKEILGDSAYVADCEDGGSCVGRLIETVIKSNFGARCDISIVDKQLYMYFEIYGKPKSESAYRTIGQFNEKVKNFAEMQAMVKKRIPAMFLKITRTLRENCEADGSVWMNEVCKTKEQIAQEDCESKGSNWIWTNGACKSSVQIVCEATAGKKWVSGECKSKEQMDCESKKGHVWGNGSCISPEQRDCIEKEREWVNGICRSPAAPVKTPQQITPAKMQRVILLPALADSESKITSRQLGILEVEIRYIAMKTLPSKDFYLLEPKEVYLLEPKEVIDALGAASYYDDDAMNNGTGFVRKVSKREVNADFGTRCEVFADGKQLYMKFELYGKARTIDAFIEPVKDFEDMRAMIKKKVPAIFTKITKTP
jgi:hypothetical protein